MAQPGPHTAHPAVFMSDTPPEEIANMNDASRGIVMVMRAMQTETGEALRERITEEFTPELLFNRGTAHFPSL